MARLGFLTVLHIVLIGALHAPGVALGQSPVPAAQTPAPAKAEVAPTSPRGELTTFLQLARRARWEDASRFLEIPKGRERDAILLTKQLKAVLDEFLWLDLESLSAAPEGRLDDGLPPGREVIGRVRPPERKPEPVTLVHRPDAPEEEPHWVFSVATVARVPEWYLDVPNHWALEQLPASLLRPGPKELLRWQWIAVLLALVPLWLLGRLLAWGVRKLLYRLVPNSRPFHATVLARLRGPLTLALMLFMGFSLLPFLELYAPAEAFMRQVVKAGVVVLVFWSLWAYVTVVVQDLSQSAWARRSPSAPSLLAIGGNFAKFSLVLAGLLAAFSVLGFNVAGLLAGLGIGGIAIALAAQKTVENLFGSFSIGVDQPFNVGDFVRLGEIEGTVESIGLRSTRLRTVEHTLVTIPNGKLADREIETFAPRQRIRLHHVLAVQHGTPSDRVRALRDALDLRLRALPRLWPDRLDVRLTGVTESALRLTVTAWIETADVWEFREIQESFLLGALEDAEAAGVPLTSPARTLELVTPSPSLPNDRSSHSPGTIRP